VVIVTTADGTSSSILFEEVVLGDGAVIDE
jgi:hypothetical protein